MKKETLEALKKSILKWKRIVLSTKGLDEGVDNCSLCQMFVTNRRCEGCPVAVKSGQSCTNSPYDEWSNHQHVDHPGGPEDHRVPGCKECMRLAKKELAFLESLLPKGQSHD